MLHGARAVAAAAVMLCATARAGDAYLEVERRDPTPTIAGPITALARAGDALLAGTGRGVWTIRGGRATPIAGFDGPIAAIVASGDGAAVALAVDGTLLRVDATCARLERDLGRPRALVATRQGPVALADRLAAGPSRDGFLFIIGDRLIETARGEVAREVALPGEARAIACDDRRAFVALESGGLVIVPRGGAPSRILRGPDGLPSTRLDALAVDGDDLWGGCVHGAFAVPIHHLMMRAREPALATAPIEHPAARVFAGPRWLPDDRVRAIAPDGRGGAAIATESGLVELVVAERSLEAKARAFEEAILARHLRHGLVNPVVDGKPRATDNDGLWTSLWAAAMCVKWNVTGDPGARAAALDAIHALERLEEVTGQPGLVARTILEKGEVTPGHGVYRPSGDGKMIWKAGASSDELDGHFFAYDVFARSFRKSEPDEVARASAVVGRIATRILDGHYRYPDWNGEPTRWGVWSPEELNGDPAWADDRGLNSLEILSHLAVAHELTRDERFARAAEALIVDHHYDDNLLRVKVTAPGHVNHSDDQLASLAFAPLRDRAFPSLNKERVDEASRRWWSAVRVARNPLFASFGEAPDDLAAARRTLEEIPLDLRTWPARNRWREDVAFDPDLDRHGHRQALVVLPMRERGVHRWNANPYVVDDDGAPNVVEEGTFFLLPYWLGRAGGWIDAPR